MTFLYNLSSLKGRRRQLRQQPIPSEAKLWMVLRNRQFLGLKFRRQYSIGMYIVDFYCPKIHLAIEVDGESHLRPGRDRYDAYRQRWLESRGIRVVRFLSIDVMRNITGVVERLEEIVGKIQMDNYPQDTS